MAKQFIIGALSVVIGMIGGMIIMMGLHMASGLVYPIPESIDMTSSSPENTKLFNEWIATLPVGAFVLMLLSHGLGSMSGAVIAMLVSGRRSMKPAIIIGVLFTLCGIANLMMISHPVWVATVDVPIYMVFALIAGRLLVRERTESP